MTRKRQHTHQYVRIYPYSPTLIGNLKRHGVWSCALPDCTHYMPYNVANQVEGKMSLCNNCMSVFQLDEENMKDDKPICTRCTHPEQALPADYDWERAEAKSYIAEKTGKAMEDITSEEIDRMVRFRRLNIK